MLLCSEANTVCVTSEITKHRAVVMYLFYVFKRVLRALKRYFFQCLLFLNYKSLTQERHSILFYKITGKFLPNSTEWLTRAVYFIPVRFLELGRLLAADWCINGLTDCLKVGSEVYTVDYSRLA